jgi:hypothetical protein
VEFLSKFSPVPSPHVASSVAALVERMAQRTLSFFVRHAALIRPLSPAGKLQLAKVRACAAFGERVRAEGRRVCGS